MPSHVEKHLGWNEEIVIQEGDVRLNSGGTAVNAREISPGEFNGDSITGGTSVLMHPGDIAIIPAGTWHEEVISEPDHALHLVQDEDKTGPWQCGQMSAAKRQNSAIAAAELSLSSKRW